MDTGTSLALIALLIAACAFFSISEIAVAASRRLRLRQLADEGEPRAARVLAVQDAPGSYFTVVQIGLNAVAILGGIVGEGALSPALTELLRPVAGSEERAQTFGFLLSFSLVTALFILFADLFPKRLAMSQPERVAVHVVGPMLALAALFKPLVWGFDRASDAIFRLLGLPPQRDEIVTHADILAMTEAGAAAGTVDAQEQQVIVNLFELDTRTVESVMTPRDHIVHFRLDDPPELIRARIAAEPHSTYLVCDGGIDKPVGYVDAKDLLLRELADQPIALGDKAHLHPVLVIPDRLTLLEVLEQFRSAREDFAVILNEYSLVVGIITLNDVMSTVMAGLVTPLAEEQICRREDGSWLIDGLTPIPDVLRALELDALPQQGKYDTLAGFLMVMLRRIPRRTDRIEAAGHRFEVLDVDDYKIDQVLVTRLPDAAAR
ncbi:hemolysin family protein [Aquariibacter albus]|uniref:HlyC/CorC family transporter n=1 Tax=Aquariibacter albus TaxID=2759899 RepID=A0A839HVG8_9BURK|nr:hemolysin family protein [Aquariibacter albus]MBB1162494.1 HlyC/CorC family transporter [Aquariibacter albus]